MIKELLVVLTLGGSTDVQSNIPIETRKTDEAYCLAQNVYFESRSQGTAGQLAVMAVTINRLNDPRFPNTLCEVVKQGIKRPSWKQDGTTVPIKNKCQFSWYCDGKSDDIKNKEVFDSIFDLTLNVVTGTIKIIDITDGATHYHADYVFPSWARTKTKTIEIEDHIFYRWEN